MKSSFAISLESFLPNFILLQVELVQGGHVGRDEDVLQVNQVPLGVDQLGEGVGQVELLEVVEVGENPEWKSYICKFRLESVRTLYAVRLPSLL